MGAGKNKSHRKKRISKHVLQAEERRKQSEVEQQLISAAEGGAGSGVGTVGALPTIISPNKNTKTGKKRKKSGQQQPSQSSESQTESSSSKTKDPEEAASYLTLWNLDQTNKKEGKKASNTWKFNKNTQSWLLRHMYDSNKVPKATFAILIDYLCSGGEGTRCRVEEDAKVRAKRYKEWEKQQPKVEGEDENKNDEENVKDEEAKKEQSKSKDNSGLTGEDLWDQLDDHDKRKEYKRARKVMDALKAVREESKES